MIAVEGFWVDLAGGSALKRAGELQVHGVVKRVKVAYVLADVVAHHTLFLVVVLRRNVHWRILFFYKLGGFLLLAIQV